MHRSPRVGLPRSLVKNDGRESIGFGIKVVREVGRRYGGREAISQYIQINDPEGSSRL